MDEDNLEIVVEPGNWQIPGKAKRWAWKVLQKHPPKFLLKGITRGTEREARDAAQAAKARILETEEFWKPGDRGARLPW